MMGVNQTYYGRHFAMYTLFHSNHYCAYIKSSCCTPSIKTVLYVNSISVNLGEKD